MSKMEEQLSEQRIKTAKSENMAQIMLEQNKILMLQVNQMNAMQLEVKLFMNRFPISNQQAEIQHTIEDLQLHRLNIIPDLEELLEEFIIKYKNKLGVQMCFVNILDSENQ